MTWAIWIAPSKAILIAVGRRLAGLAVGIFGWAFQRSRRRPRLLGGSTQSLADLIRQALRAGKYVLTTRPFEFDADQALSRQTLRLSRSRALSRP